MLRLFGLIDNNSLKIPEKALAALGPFSTILRVLLSIIPQNVTLIPYYNKSEGLGRICNLDTME